MIPSRNSAIWDSTHSVLMLSQRMVGGASEHIKVLGRELQRKGWLVSVAANWSPEFSTVSRDVFETLGMTTHQIDFPSPRINKNSRIAGDVARAGHSLLRLVQSPRPDVVHAHWRSVLPYCAFPHFPPVVFTKHYPGATDWMSNLTYKIPRRMIAISSELEQEMLTESRVSPNRIRRINHGVDEKYAEPPTGTTEELRRSLGLPRSDFVLVSVGRLVHQKNHSLTLEAVRRLRDEGLRLHLVIVGDGPLAGELRQQTAQLRLSEHVTFTGDVEPVPYFDSADAFVLSSLFEGFALAVVEAMMRGLPPIRTQTEGAVDQIESGVSGLLFAPGDLIGLMDSVRLLASDPCLCKRMGDVARERSRTTFTSTRMAKKTEIVYRELFPTHVSHRS